jgi:DnaJ-domain-containing protein 1
MNLPGRLKLTTLGDLLGDLHRAKASGVLELFELEGVSAGRCHRVFLDAGLVDGVDSSLPSPRLGELLVREGFLTLDGVRTLLRRLVEEPDKKAGQILLSERLLDTGLLQAALRAQLRSKLDALFRLPDARVRFHVRRPRDGQQPSPLTPREFLFGRPRARARSQGRAEKRPPPPQLPSADAQRRAAYRELGLEPGTDAETLRRTFRKLAASHHPDRYPRASSREKELIAQRFSRISEAYHRLAR